MTADNITATSISLSWISAGSEGVSYVVTWQTDDVGGCSGGNDTGSMNINDGSTSYDIMELEEDSSYNMIIVTASNSAGSSAVSNTVNAMTKEAGERAIFSGHLLMFMAILPVPSAAPSSVSVSVVNSTAFTVQWGMITCINRNGDITGYRIHVVGSVEMEKLENVGDDVREVTISQLTPSTTYSIQVAAVNNIGPGPYSDPIIIDTPDGMYICVVYTSWEVGFDYNEIFI